MQSGSVEAPAMCRNRKQLSSQSPQQLTAGQMGGCQSPGFELLWHSFSCPLPPATVPTANQSPVRSFKVLAKLLTEQSLKDKCPCLPGRSKIARTLFPSPTPGIYSLEEQPCPADELPEAFGRASCTQALIISKWRNGQGGLWRSTPWHDLHIDGKGEGGDSNGVSVENPLHALWLHPVMILAIWLFRPNRNCWLKYALKKTKC